MREEVSDYIAFAQRQGKSTDEISSFLTEKGWTHEEIQQGYCHAKNLEVAGYEKPKFLTKTKVLIIEFLVIVVIAFTVVGAIIVKTAFERLMS